MGAFDLADFFGGGVGSIGDGEDVAHFAFELVLSGANGLGVDVGGVNYSIDVGVFQDVQCTEVLKELYSECEWFGELYGTVGVPLFVLAGDASVVGA